MAVGEAEGLSAQNNWFKQRETRVCLGRLLQSRCHEDVTVRQRIWDHFLSEEESSYEAKSRSGKVKMSVRT